MSEFEVATVEKASDIPAELERRYREGWTLLQAYWGGAKRTDALSPKTHILIFIRSGAS
jgi:hypothetical protein